jgi:hypothetical protein
MAADVTGRAALIRDNETRRFYRHDKYHSLPEFYTDVVKSKQGGRAARLAPSHMVIL